MLLTQSILLAGISLSWRYVPRGQKREEPGAGAGTDICFFFFYRSVIFLSVDTSSSKPLSSWTFYYLYPPRQRRSCLRRELTIKPLSISTKSSAMTM